MGVDNTFVGSAAGLSNTTGSDNTFVGRNSGEGNTTGVSNSFFGQASGQKNTTGGNNSFFGSYSGLNNTTGVSNSFFGAFSGLENTTGARNTYFGQDSGQGNTTGISNSFFGQSAGDKNLSGSYNIAIGRGAGPTATNAGMDHRLYIDVDPSSTSAGNDDPLIYGEFDNDFVRINGTFEVTAGLTNPSSVLDKINQLDISEWSYKHDPEVRHIGPTAESFYEAFGLGTGGDNISTIDADGVSLVAIQALTDQVAMQREELDEKDIEKDQEIKNLEERLLRIEQLLLSDKNE